VSRNRSYLLGRVDTPTTCSAVLAHILGLSEQVSSVECRVASGEWRVASGEWRVASGEWRVASGALIYNCDFVA
jgi:hypothetical protein